MLELDQYVDETPASGTTARELRVVFFGAQHSSREQGRRKDTANQSTRGRKSRRNGLDKQERQRGGRGERGAGQEAVQCLVSQKQNLWGPQSDYTAQQSVSQSLASWQASFLLSLWTNQPIPRKETWAF